MKNKTLTIGLVVAILIALGAYAFPRTVIENGFGASTPGTRFPHGVTIGPDGSNNAEIKAGTCTLTTTVAQLPLATSSKPFDCAATGVASGDIVFGTLAGDGQSLGGTAGIKLSHMIASTTANVIQVWLSHQSDNVLAAATSSFPTATSSFQYFYIDTQ